MHAPQTLATAKHRPIILQEDKAMSYLSLKWGEDMLMKKTYYSSGSPDRILGFEGREYEIIHSELKTRDGNGFSEDNSKNSRRCRVILLAIPRF